jgi:MFS family permease
LNGALSWPFLRLYALSLLYFSANAILNVIIPLKGESLGATNTTIGIIMGAYLFTTMFFRPWAGRVIQKHGPIKVLRFILLINGVALILYAFSGLEGYFFARILQGICTAFFSMTLQLGIMDALPDEERSKGISMYSLSSYLPAIIGPLLALGIWQAGDMDIFAMVMITLAIFTGVVGYSAKIESKPTEDASNSQSQGLAMWSSLGQLIKNPYLYKSSVLMLMASIIFGAVLTFIPLYADAIENGDAGYFLMFQAATVVLVRFALKGKIPSDGRWRSPYMMFIMFILAVAVQSISYSIIGGALFFYVGAFLIGTSQALLYPTLTTYLSFVLPKGERNVLIGLFIATADLGIAMGGVIMGPIADISSYSFMYMVCAILGASMVLFAYDYRKILVEIKSEVKND